MAKRALWTKFFFFDEEEPKKIWRAAAQTFAKIKKWKMLLFFILF